MSDVSIALKAMYEGKKVRCKTKTSYDCWTDPTYYIFYNKLDKKIYDVDGAELDISIVMDFLDNEWEIIDDYDWNEIIQNQYLCWFWNDNKNNGIFGLLLKVDKNSSYPFIIKDNDDIGFKFKIFKNCRPVHPREINFYSKNKE